MFLAKTWVTKNGVKYESWVLKKSVWDKELKRARQVYLAHLGKSKSLSLEKAQAICEKIGVTLDELRAVKRLRIRGFRKQPIRKIEKSKTPKELKLGENVAPKIADLRKKYGLAPTPEGYQQLAMRIGVLRVTARELQNAESGHGGLRRDQLAAIEQMLRAKR